MNKLLQLIGASALAQLVSILISPVLSRLYSPDDFGTYGNIIIIVYFINAFSLLRLEINLLKSSSDKEEIYSYAVSYLLLISVGTSLIVWFFKFDLNYFLLPFLLLISGYYNLLHHDLLGKNKIKDILNNKFLLAFLIAIFQIVAGLISNTAFSLLVGQLIGMALTLLFMPIIFCDLKFKGVLRKYKKQLLYDAPSNAINVLSNHLPFLLFFQLFGAISAGYYYMAFRILILPINVISTSTHSFIAASHEHEDNLSVQKRLLRIFIIFPLPFIIIVHFYINNLVDIFLGNNWYITGNIIRYCLGWIYIRFIFDSFLINYSLKDNQEVNLIFQVFSIILQASSIIICFILNLDFIEAIKTFCFISSITYVIGLYFLLKKSNILDYKLFSLLIFSLSILTYILLD